jgi:hypothetical protein
MSWAANKPTPMRTETLWKKENKEPEAFKEMK